MGLLLCAPVVPSAFALPATDGADDSSGSHDVMSRFGISSWDTSESVGYGRYGGWGLPRSRHGNGRESLQDNAAVVQGLPAQEAGDADDEFGVSDPAAAPVPDAVAVDSQPDSRPIVIKLPDLLQPSTSATTGDADMAATPPVVIPLITGQAISVELQVPAIPPILAARDLLATDLGLPSVLPVDLFPSTPGSIAPPVTIPATNGGRPAVAWENPAEAPTVDTAARIPDESPAQLPEIPADPGIEPSTPGENAPPPAAAAPVDTPSKVQAETAYETTASPAQLVSATLPGLAAILLLTTAGSFIGYRHVRAGGSVQGTGVARFLP